MKNDDGAATDTWHPDVCPCPSGCQSNADTWPSSNSASCVTGGDGGSTDDFLFLRKQARCVQCPPLLPLRLHHFHLHLCPSIYHSSTPLSIHLLPSLSQCLSFRRYQPPLSRSLSTPTQLHSFTCRYLSGWTNRLPRWCSRGNNKQVNMGGARTPRLCNNVQNTPSYVGHRFGFMLFFKGVFSVRGFKVTEGIFLES